MRKYIWTTLRHKYWVWWAGRRVGGISLWQLLVHDWTKFLPRELFAYARWFSKGQQNRDEFATALLHHKNQNPHHYEYWISRERKDGILGMTLQALPMPEKYVREMVADWWGAQLAYTGKTDTDPREWYCRRRETILLHPDTRVQVEALLTSLFGPLPMTVPSG